MSIRLALKRSLEGPPPDEASPAIQPATKTTTTTTTNISSNNNNNNNNNNNGGGITIMAKKKERRTHQNNNAVIKQRRRQQQQPPKIIQPLPKIRKCVRNDDPSRIDEYGFVEVANALPRRLIELIYKEASEKVARFEARTANGSGGGRGGGGSGSRAEPSSSSSTSKNALKNKAGGALPKNKGGGVWSIPKNKRSVSPKPCKTNSGSSNSGGSPSKRRRPSPSAVPPTTSYAAAVSAAAAAAAAASSSATNNNTNDNNPEVEEISNALQVDVSRHLQHKIQMAITMEGACDSTAYSKTMRSVYGIRNNNDEEDGPTNNDNDNYNGYVLETPKVLITPPGSAPQLPHADDHCTSCLICLIHLKDFQEPTRVAPYVGKTKDYPTGITVECDECQREEQLPDSDYRRGIHLTDDPWACNACSGKGKHRPYDFEGKLTEAFGELLLPDAPELCDAYAGGEGKEGMRAGNGLLGLPTLVHRGPGNPAGARGARYILFFSLRPLFANMKGPAATTTDGTISTNDIIAANGNDGGNNNNKQQQQQVLYHQYNPNLQIHASCILYNQFKKVKTIYERSGCDLGGYFGAIVKKDTAELMRENEELKEENERLRKKLDRIT